MIGLHTIRRTIDPAQDAQQPEAMAVTLFTGEARAHRIILAARSGAITGSVSARALRADQVTVEFDGEITAEGAVLTLPAECYAAPGPLLISAYLTEGEEIDCVWQGRAQVLETGSETVIQSGGRALTLAALEERIAALEAAANA